MSTKAIADATSEMIARFLVGLVLDSGLAISSKLDSIGDNASNVRAYK
tara:strand:- start:3931 stop:4074 length:144 start_codon:yes stop_codon:yes gene_type:complete